MRVRKVGIWSFDFEFVNIWDGAGLLGQSQHLFILFGFRWDLCNNKMGSLCLLLSELTFCPSPFRYWCYWYSFEGLDQVCLCGSCLWASLRLVSCHSTLLPQLLFIYRKFRRGGGRRINWVPILVWVNLNFTLSTCNVYRICHYIDNSRNQSDTEINIVTQ